MSWPFDSDEAEREHVELRAKGYALLKQAHEQWMRAWGERQKHGADAQRAEG